MNIEHHTNDARWSVRHSNMICPKVKMSTLGLRPRVDILTLGHIILVWHTMNIMRHTFCHMTNCDVYYYKSK